MKNELNEKKYGAISFLPLIVFLALYIGSGIFFTLIGVEGAFKKFPRHVALLAGIIVALLSMSACPTAVVSYTMAKEMNADGDLAGEIVATTSILSIFTIFCWVLTLKNLGWI